ncbi:MAG: NUDIX hydrolase [Gammaproteobacteria bacterium]|nr:NUDIX hydrolase [Gammaproteobacteria bacterium]|tara:strand:- start:2288 stop:2755 length:468 start_codon:yes stop_codon:yes gene_type:complete
MSWYPHQTVAVVVENPAATGAPQFLIVEEINAGRVVFNQPAGHLEPDESLALAAVREALEETAWHVELTGFIGVYQSESAATGICYIRNCFVARALRHDTGRSLDGDIVRTHWFTLAELQARQDQLRSPAVIAVIEDYLAGQVYPLNLVRDLGRA